MKKLQKSLTCINNVLHDQFFPVRQRLVIIDTTYFRRILLRRTMISMWMEIRKTLTTRTINRPMTSMEIMMGLQYFHFMCFMPFFCTLLHSYFEHVLIATLIATPSLTLYVRWNMDHNMFFIS